MKSKIVVIQGRGSIGVRHANNIIQLGYEPIFLRSRKKNYPIPHDKFNIKEMSDISRY